MESEQDETPRIDEAHPALLADFDLPSAPGNEYQAMRRVVEAVAALGLPPDRLEKLKTAVAEAVMNAMEHGNRYRDGQPVGIQAEYDSQRLVVRIADQGGSTDIPGVTAPDMEQKLAGLQSSRGWGLFLIKSTVDETHRISDGQRQTLELILHLQTGETDDKG